MMVDLSGTARAMAGMVALVIGFGLAVQFNASLSRVGAWPETLWIMLRFFTVIANLLAAIVLAGAALGLPGFASPARLGGVAVAMMLVGIVYALLLRGMLELSGGDKLADDLLHVVAPVLVPLFWLFFVPKGGLRRADPLWWTLLPVVYFAYALTRGAWDGNYPYPFMNVATLGWRPVALTALVMAAGFIATGFAMLWLDRRLSRRPAAG
jgi:hypothetical protein